MSVLVSPLLSMLDHDVARSPTVLLNDVTLREAEQSVGISLAIETKVALARALQEIGVRRLQIGYAGRPEDAQAARRIKRDVSDAAIEMLVLAFLPSWPDAREVCLAAGGTSSTLRTGRRPGCTRFWASRQPRRSRAPVR